MRPRPALLLLALLGTVTAVATAAREASATSTPIIQAHTSEFSSVVRKKKRVVVVQPVQQRAFGWRGADPSFDEYGRLYRPPAHLSDCAIDLGYGRWRSCHTND